MNIDTEKRRVADLAASYANDPAVVSMTLVMTTKDGTSRFHVTPMPDEIAKLCLAIGVCGAAGCIADAKMDPKP